MLVEHASDIRILREVCIKARSTPASLPFKGQVTVYYKSRLKKLAEKLTLPQLGETVEKRTNLRLEGKPINN